MLIASDIIIDAFIDRLRADYRQIYGQGPNGHLATIEQVARMSLHRIARSTAFYHTIDHTILVTLVGQDILRGRMVRDGQVASRDWVQFVSALLCFCIGFVRDACPGDQGDTVVINARGETAQLPPGKTDGVLWRYFTDRSKLFVQHQFRGHPVLDAETLTSYIEYSRFPPLPDRNLETDSFPGLLRAAHIIGAVADPDFLLKMTPLYIELKESGVIEDLGYDSVSALRTGYPQLFWGVLYAQIPEAVRLLAYTGQGRAWLANMYAHVLTGEHKDRLNIAS